MDNILLRCPACNDLCWMTELPAHLAWMHCDVDWIYLECWCGFRTTELPDLKRHWGMTPGVPSSDYSKIKRCLALRAIRNQP